MELAYVYKTLIDRKLALVLIAILAAAIAVLSGYKVSGSGLTPRSLSYGAATQQVLIDSPQSALVDLKKDTGPLAVRALVYAQFMRSTAIVDGVATRLGVQRAQITTQGPFGDVGASQNAALPATARSGQIADEREVYRLAFDAQENLPVITIYAQAPTDRKAFALSNAAVASLTKYVDDLQNKEGLRPVDRVTVRALGAPDGGTVDHGTRKTVMFLIFFAIFGVGCVLIIAWASLRRGLRELDRVEAEERSHVASWVDPDALAAVTSLDPPELEPELRRERQPAG